MKNYSHPVIEQYNLVVDSNGSVVQVNSSRELLVRHFIDVVNVSCGLAASLADGVILDALEEVRSLGLKK